MALYNRSFTEPYKNLRRILVATLQWSIRVKLQTTLEMKRRDEGGSRITVTIIIKNMYSNTDGVIYELGMTYCIHPNMIDAVNPKQIKFALFNPN